MTVDEEASVDDEKVKVDEASVVEEAPDEDPTRSNIQLVKPTKSKLRKHTQIIIDSHKNKIVVMASVVVGAAENNDYRYSR